LSHQGFYGKLTGKSPLQDRIKSGLDPALAGDARWQLIQRVVSSKTFASSRPLQDFLLFVAERTLLGRLDEIKEQTIGSNVLRPSSNFDPATDNIVRVRARQLRLRLEQFFQSEGGSEPLFISIPRGGYIPVFEPRVATSHRILRGPEASHRRRVLRSWLPWSITAALAVVCVLLWVAPDRWRGNASTELPSESRRFWSQILTRNETTQVILSDPSFGLWQQLTNKDPHLQGYLRLQGRYGDAPADASLMTLLTSNQVSLSAAHFLTSVVPISEVLHARMNVRPAWQTDVTDFKAGNVILMGGRRSNPWIELFEKHLHNVEVYPAGGRSHYERRPNDLVRLKIPDNAEAQSYAVIALLPNITSTGKVLLIEGLTMEGTDGAIEFLARPPSCALLVRRLISELGSVDRPFEALLQLTPVSGGSANVRLIGLWSPLP
jgi:hypothetical protein